MSALYSLSEDQQSLRQAARRFAQQEMFPISMEIERDRREVPLDFLKKMGSLGFLGLDVPTEYGGQGFDTLTCAVIMEELSGGWFSGSSFCMALGMGPVLAGGTEKQKREYLPRICKGEIIPAFALTEPTGGSDAAAITTFARKDGSDYVLRGTKIFITNAHRADIVVVFAKTNNEAARGQGISAFLVPKGTKGFSTGQKFRALAHHANPISEVIFDDCRIPAANLIGEEGKGFSYVHATFAKFRAVYGSRCVGVAQAAMDYALRYANEREQFGQAIASYQGIRFKVADVMTKIEAARHLSYRAAAIVDQGVDTDDARVAASMAKHFGSNVCMEATSEAIQIMGGHGYIADHPLERLYREAKLFQIGDGTSEVLRLLISRYTNKCANAGEPARLP